MRTALTRGLSSRNAFVRKGAAAALRVPKWWRGLRTRAGDYKAAPPVLANSFPKSGTHLLYQIVAGLPRRANYGAFLSSMTSSFQFRERSLDDVGRFIRAIIPGEIVRGHLFHHPQTAVDLAQRNVVHYFIYRDPRDVALSGAHYVRSMNRWHKLHRYYRRAKSIDEAITMAILGLEPPVPGVEFPDVAQRFGRYRGWLDEENCLAIRYEELQSEARPTIVRQMAEFYAARASEPLDIEACVASMLQHIAPKKSHTFRSGEKAGWRKAFSHEHRRLFHQVAGDLLIELGYEEDASWVDSSEGAEASGQPAPRPAV